ncbi:MAG: leucine-rich repeat protein [Odoribacteraceae bacterium]|jgi:hypothetical protein|nr:leucine-rich repeat protein [Odoribacteraceae bacterium]
MKKIKHLIPVALLGMASALLAACGDDNSKSTGIPVTEISVAEATATGSGVMEVTVKERETLRLTTTVLPLDATYRRVLFESSNPEIFTVTQTGLISALHMGTATLRVFAADGGGAATEYSVYIDYRAGILNVKTPGSLAQLLATASASDIAELKLAGTFNDADLQTLAAKVKEGVVGTIDMSLASVPNNTLTGVFEDAVSLTSVIVPNTLVTIGDDCFKNSPVASVTLPATLTTIGAGAFSDCAALTSITLAAATPPTVAADAFEGITMAEIELTVPSDATNAYREADIWKKMTVNGLSPAATTYEIPPATGTEQWVTVTLESPLSTSEPWEIKAVSTQLTDDPAKLNFGDSGWGVHLLRLNYTGTITGSRNGNGEPTEFYLGGVSQGGTKIGAIGRGNWNSTTHTLTPSAITLNKPVTIVLTCDGEGMVACTIQNENINGGEPLPFGELVGMETITAIRAAHAAVTYITVTMK